MWGRTLVLVGAGALLAACGGLGSKAGTPAASGASASPGRAGSAVAGQVVQLSGGRMVVNGQAGSVTVTYDSSTSVLQSGAGSLADLTAGTCVTATGERAAGGGITATAVQAMLNMNGQCTQPAGASPGAGAQGRGAVTSPGQGRRPSGGAPSAGPTPANLAFVRGRVTSVDGSTVTVQPATGDAVAVTVPDTVRVTRTVASTPARLAVGECIDATGQRSSSGVLQARVLTIVAPGPNGCSGAGFLGPGGGGRPSASPR